MNADMEEIPKAQICLHCGCLAQELFEVMVFDGRGCEVEKIVCCGSCLPQVRLTASEED